MVNNPAATNQQECCGSAGHKKLSEGLAIVTWFISRRVGVDRGRAGHVGLVKEKYKNKKKLEKVEKN